MFDDEQSTYGDSESPDGNLTKLLCLNKINSVMSQACKFSKAPTD